VVHQVATDLLVDLGVGPGLERAREVALDLALVVGVEDAVGRASQRQKYSPRVRSTEEPLMFSGRSGRQTT
jgi:hypothetical protein